MPYIDRPTPYITSCQSCIVTVFLSFTVTDFHLLAYATACDLDQGSATQTQFNCHKSKCAHGKSQQYTRDWQSSDVTLFFSHACMHYRIHFATADTLHYRLRLQCHRCLCLFLPVCTNALVRNRWLLHSPSSTALLLIVTCSNYRDGASNY